MYIIEVIPITNLPPQVPQLLSYYFNRALLKGAIVEVLVGNRKIIAAVTSSTSLEEQKISLKKSNFQLKKLSAVISETPLVSDAQFKIALWLSRNYFASLGLCLKTVLPSFFLKKNYEFKISKLETANNKQLTINKPSILVSRAKDVIKNIETEVKKILKNKKQVLIILPEITVAGSFYEYFAGYYEVALVNSKIPVKQLYKTWNRISSGEAEIIIGTRQALFSPFLNLGLIIMEDPANEAYKSDMSPKYNTRDLVKKIAEMNSAGILYVSQIPDMTNYLLAKNETYLLNDKKSKPKTEIKFENMIQEVRSGNFSVFSRELISSISEYVEDKRILIFSGRKGYSSSLSCENCGFHFNCPQCSIPFRVRRIPEKMLVCRRCSTVAKIPEFCPNCKSGKLKNSGFIGSEKIKEQLAKLLESWGIKKEIIILDSDSDQKLSEDDTSICIATQSIFSHRFKLNFDLIGIPSMDSLTTIPDFRTEEQLFLQFEKLLDFNPELIVGQTYNTSEQILGALTAGDYRQFYDKELPVRKLFGYPPFARLVKLSHSSFDRNKAEYEARILNEKLKMALVQRKLTDNVKIVGPSPAFVEKEKNLYIYNIILKIALELNPDEVLRFVPSHWMIDVDPKSIL